MTAPLVWFRSTHHAARVVHRVRDFGSFWWPTGQPVRFLCGRHGMMRGVCLYSAPRGVRCPLCAARGGFDVEQVV